MVECHLPKVKVASSSLVARSSFFVCSRDFFIAATLISFHQQTRASKKSSLRGLTKFGLSTNITNCRSSMVFHQNLKKFEILSSSVDMRVYICIINSFASTERSEVKEVDI